MLSIFRPAQSYQRNFLILDAAKFLIAVGLLTWFMVKGSGNLSYNWQWYRIPEYLFTFADGRFVTGPLLEGLKVTFQITIISLLLSSLLGLATAIFRLSDSLIARILARGYLELIRNTPLLVQLFFIYFVISPVFGISRFASAVLTLSIFEGAYASEIFRAGIVSIHKGQWEAAYSIGLNNFHAYRHIILPQAIRRMLPPLAGQAISLVKDSALVSTIAIYDLTMKGQEIIAETYLVFEIWFTIAAIYLIITATLSVGVNILEKRFAIEM
ncbi:MAG: amino acid ABC transporter permease [Deltaproteobacteria bacterium]|nr:amino acid ABC transporter permease [Deltaproteobacteria bacterium]